MSRTLLYTVQRVLEKLDLDPVDTVKETDDARAVVTEAQDTFFDLISRNDFPERADLLELQTPVVEVPAVVLPPTALQLPENHLGISSLRYEIEEEVVSLIQLTPEEFLEVTYGRNKESDEVIEYSYKDKPLYIINNQPPTYYTSFDNEYIILDSWETLVEPFVSGDKTVALGSKVPDWSEEDEFIIPMDVVTYPLYLAELTAACSLYMMGKPSEEDERRRRIGMSRMRRKAFRTNIDRKKNDFGRRSPC